MSRKSLKRRIEQLDNSLGARQGELARLRSGAAARLRAVHPLWWLGGGVVIGYWAGLKGGVASLRYVRTGFTLLSLVRSGLGVGADEL